LSEKRHPDQERASNRRKQVLDAAESCFRLRGFHAASMAEISKAAGMSAGHIYNYFDGKDAIIAAFVQQNLERVSALLHDLERHADPLQAILDDMELSVRRNLDSAFWKMPLEIFSEASRNPTIATLLQDADRQSREELRRIIKLGRERRGLASDDGELAGRVEAIISMFQGLHLRALHSPALDEPALVAAFRLAMTPLLLG
jgi:AcrR family transcriptional regulator